MGIAVAVIYLPTLLFLCWITGVVGSALVLGSTYPVRWVRVFLPIAVILGALTVSAVSLAVMYWASQIEGNEWGHLFNPMLASLIAPICLGTFIGYISRKLSEKRQDVGLLLNRFAIGGLQSIWLVPNILHIYVHVHFGKFKGRGDVDLAFFLIVAGFLLSAGFAKLALRPFLENTEDANSR